MNADHRYAEHERDSYGQLAKTCAVWVIGALASVVLYQLVGWIAAMIMLTMAVIVSMTMLVKGSFQDARNRREWRRQKKNESYDH